MGASGAPDVSYTTKTMGDDIIGLFDQMGLSGIRIMGHGRHGWDNRAPNGHQPPR